MVVPKGMRLAKMIVNGFIISVVMDKGHSAIVHPEEDLLEEGEYKNRYFRRVRVSPEEGYTITGKIDFFVWPLKEVISEERREPFDLPHVHIS